MFAPLNHRVFAPCFACHCSLVAHWRPYLRPKTCLWVPEVVVWHQIHHAPCLSRASATHMCHLCCQATNQTRMVLVSVMCTTAPTSCTQYVPWLLIILLEIASDAWLCPHPMLCCVIPPPATSFTLICCSLSHFPPALVYRQPAPFHHLRWCFLCPTCRL